MPSGGIAIFSGNARHDYVTMVLAFHKPYGVLSQFTPDGSANRTLAEFGFPPGVYPIGRLDADSEGLLLLSDEPGFNSRLLDPERGHPRRYWAQVERIPNEEALAKLSYGMTIRDHTTRPCHAELLDPQPQIPPRDPPIRVRKNVPDCWILLSLAEGKPPGAADDCGHRPSHPASAAGTDRRTGTWQTFPGKLEGVERRGEEIDFFKRAKMGESLNSHEIPPGKLFPAATPCALAAWVTAILLHAAASETASATGNFHPRASAKLPPGCPINRPDLADRLLTEPIGRLLTFLRMP